MGTFLLSCPSDHRFPHSPVPYINIVFYPPPSSSRPLMATTLRNPYLLPLPTFRIASRGTLSLPPTRLLPKQSANSNPRRTNPPRLSSFRPPRSIEESTDTDDSEETDPSQALPTTSPSFSSSSSSFSDDDDDDDEKLSPTVTALLQSVEEEKSKVGSLLEEVRLEKDRVVRISADFENYRKRMEREKWSLMEDVKGEVVERLLPVLDGFERAGGQIRAETEVEEKMMMCGYQSIYKQFIEILNALGVWSIESVGFAFDPKLHEAIVREDSTEHEEGIVMEEFRKGFVLGEKLLRPSMVKVSSGSPMSKREEEEDTQEDEGREEYHLKDEDSILAQEFQ